MLHHMVEGQVASADNRISSSGLLLCPGDVSSGVVVAGRSAGGGGPGHGQQTVVCRRAAVLRRPWPPSPCRGSAPCGLCLVAGGGGWCCCWAAMYATLSVAACNQGSPSLTSASTSGLSSPVLPRRLWQVVSWVGFLSDMISGVEIALWEGCYPALTLAYGVCVIVYVQFLSAGAGTVWGGGSSLHSGIEFGRSRTCEGSLGGRKRGVV